MLESFYSVLFTTLLANMPKDTRNMMTQSSLIGIKENATHHIITISGPYKTNPKYTGKKDGNYASAVNYNKQRSVKEVANYKYVERNIKQVAQLFNLRVVDL